MTCGFSLAVFNTVSLFYIFSVLSIICHEEFLFWPCLLGVLCTSVYGYAFPQFGGPDIEDLL